ncbi:helix-turn-helix domain-containing protein [Prescottella agglutinans]|uniref:DUF2637 domain-containing protein n=1 Tax=Prescottella agglutinans TaxID=1644129 RepID=A0ABT6MI46_9NOCA|nr:helix-turn-helix domain-containing protein [Prescottella agglutinans]MDH6283550.1 hypothetical protein [Prescottella agglutinans]
MTTAASSLHRSTESRRGAPATVAVVGTVAIYAAAAVLSFGSLSDIAQRSNVTVPELWPLIIDGVVLAATVAVVAGAGGYAWFLVVVGTATSLLGNVLHAAAPDGPLPVFVRAIVAAVPPLALVAVAHLAVTLRRTSNQATAAATVDDALNQTEVIGDRPAPHHGDEQKGPHPVRTPDVLEEDIPDASGDIATTHTGDTVAPPVATPLQGDTATATVDASHSANADTSHSEDYQDTAEVEIHLTDAHLVEPDGDTVAATATPDQSPSDTATPSDDDTKTRAMEMLAAGIPPREVAEQLGVHRGTAYKWRAALQAH